MKTRTFRIGRRGHIAETAYNSYMAYVYNHDTRIRKCFKSFRDAEAYILAVESNIALPPLTSAQIIDAQLAYRDLPQGLSLQDVVKDYIRTRPKISSSIKLSQLSAEYFQAKSMRDATIQSYRVIINKVVSALGDRFLHEYSVDECKMLVQNQPSPHIAALIKRIMHALWAYAIQQDMCTSNIWDKIGTIKLPDKPIEILTVPQAQMLIDAIVSNHPQLVGYYAVGLFAGVRPTELQRITQDNIRDGYLYLDGSVTKTKLTRSIKIADNLQQWLGKYEYYAPRRRQLVRSHATICNALNIGEYPKDVLRHSYASYLYELTRDAPLVAAELGHTTTTMLFKHYRALAPAGSGAEYFSIVPK